MSFITDVEVVDDYTIKLTTDEPTGPMLTLLCTRGNLILDADYIEEYGKEIGYSAETVNGTGPYKLASWSRNEEMVLESHDDYFGGKPHTKTIVIQIIPEDNSRAIAIETGQVDIVDGLPGEDALRMAEIPGLAIYTTDRAGQHCFQFNCSNQYLKDSRLRQAVSYGIDRTEIVEALYSGTGDNVSTAPWHPLSVGYNNLGVIEQDQEKAKQLMADAGYPDGFEFKILTGANYDQAVEASEIIQAQLAEIGINVELEPVDSAFFRSIFGISQEEFKWGMFIMGTGVMDADESSRLWITDSSGNNNNYGWYSNPIVDELFPKAKRLVDQDERLKLYKEIGEQLFIEDPAAVWINDRKLVFAMSDKVEGLNVNMRSGIFFEELKILK